MIARGTSTKLNQVQNESTSYLGAYVLSSRCFLYPNLGVT
jgi:hypothetical protein